MFEIDTTFFLAFAVIFLASLIHGMTGFGAALVAMPLLALLMDIRVVTPMVAILTVTINAFFLFRFRRGLVPGRILYLAAGAVAGLPLGILLLRQGDRQLLEAVLGVLLLTYGLYAFFARPAVAGLGPRWAFLLGAASGCFGGALNTGGPPAVIYTASQPWSKEEIHVTLQCYFFLVGMAVVAAHALSGLTTVVTLRQCLLFMPALMAGGVSGYVLHRRVGRERYRRTLYAMLMAFGLLLLWR